MVTVKREISSAEQMAPIPEALRMDAAFYPPMTIHVTATLEAGTFRPHEITFVQIKDMSDTMLDEDSYEDSHEACCRDETKLRGGLMPEAPRALPRQESHTSWSTLPPLHSASPTQSRLCR